MKKLNFNSTNYLFGDVFCDSIITPLGVIKLSIFLEKNNLNNIEIVNNDKFTKFKVFNDNILIEIIKSDICTSHYEEFGINFLLNWIVKFITLKEKQDITLVLSYENINSIENLEIDLPSGQYYFSTNINNSKHSLSIGMEDYDFLEERFNENNFLSYDVFNKINKTPLSEIEKNNSYIIKLSDLNINDENILQFSMAYSDKYLGKDNYTSCAIGPVDLKSFCNKLGINEFLDKRY